MPALWPLTLHRPGGSRARGGPSRCRSAEGGFAILPGDRPRRVPSQVPGQIRGSGYVVESLEAALWCFYNSESFAQGVLLAANLGDDAEGTCGQIAGAHYGGEAIPPHWLNRLSMRDLIAELADRLHGAGPG